MHHRGYFKESNAYGKEEKKKEAILPLSTFQATCPSQYMSPLPGTLSEAFPVSCNTLQVSFVSLGDKDENMISVKAILQREKWNKKEVLNLCT